MNLGHETLDWLAQLPNWLTHLRHELPGQAPIRDFVHHNTLHGFQHLPFPEALETVSARIGAQTYWPEAKFRAAMASGRIRKQDLEASLKATLLDDLAQPVPGPWPLSRLEILSGAMQVPAFSSEEPSPESVNEVRLRWQARCAETLASATVAQPFLSHPLHPGNWFAEGEQMPPNWTVLAAQQWRQLVDSIGQQQTCAEVLLRLLGEEAPAHEAGLGAVHALLLRQLAAFLDQGVASWPMPDKSFGLLAAWRRVARHDPVWALLEMPMLEQELESLPEDATEILATELPRLLPPGVAPLSYLTHLCLRLPGWCGMLLRHSPDLPADASLHGQRIPLLDFLAIRVLLERLICEGLMRRLVQRPAGAMEWSMLEGFLFQCPAAFYVRGALAARRDWPEDLLDQASFALHGPTDDEQVWISLACAVHAAETTLSQRFVSASTALAALFEHLELDFSLAHALTHEQALGYWTLASSLAPAQRGWIWLQAYERRYQADLFAALMANRARTESDPALANACTAQVVMCMDEREEGTRRHLEALAPSVQTFGAAGFFGVPMYWQGLTMAQPEALCPVVVTPQHLVCEVPDLPAAGEVFQRRQAQRRGWMARWQEKTRGEPVQGAVMAVAGAPFVLAKMLFSSFFPGVAGGWLSQLADSFDRPPASHVALDASSERTSTSPPPFSLSEQITQVAGFLKMIGLTAQFAPLVLILGHGSDSRNNPHRSAYDCGACSGRHGGPNARVFAAMANRPEVRAGLRAEGIEIPEHCWFVSAQHNTCDDSVTWYDLPAVPARWQGDVDRLVGQLSAACRAHAQERCRRFASLGPGQAPAVALAHVRGRRHDPAQARPELGHATNAAAVIGRRALTRGLFLDRRVFLISYDPSTDVGGEMVERILLAAGPVGAGINLEYYFSTVDNAIFGCGSKVTHNLTGNMALMDGAASDLRTGLPWQMVEIHEPMRLLVVVEQTPECLTQIVSRQPALQELVGNGWIRVAAQDPCSGVISVFMPGSGWQRWEEELAVAQTPSSAHWCAHSSAPLPPALLSGAPE